MLLFLNCLAPQICVKLTWRSRLAVGWGAQRWLLLAHLDLGRSELRGLFCFVLSSSWPAQSLEFTFSIISCPLHVLTLSFPGLAYQLDSPSRPRDASCQSLWTVGFLRFCSQLQPWTCFEHVLNLCCCTEYSASACSASKEVESENQDFFITEMDRSVAGLLQASWSMEAREDDPQYFHQKRWWLLLWLFDFCHPFPLLCPKWHPSHHFC